MYLPSSTLGALYAVVDGKEVFVSFTVELRWLNNMPRMSCIPEGEYQMRIVVHKRFGPVYRLQDVPGRQGILIHAANAPSQLLGCIAPNTTLLTHVMGQNSRLALTALFETTRKKDLPILIRSGMPAPALP